MSLSLGQYLTRVVARAATIVVAATLLSCLGLTAANAAYASEPLPVGEATKKQRQWKKNGNYPAPPKLGSRRGLELVPKAQRSDETGPARAPKGGKRIRLNTAAAKRLWRSRTGTAHTAMFGSHGDFFAKRNQFLNYIQGYFATLVPRAGGSFRAPALYETQGGLYWTCGNQTKQVFNNAMYCQPNNYIGWTLDLSLDLWNNIGDTSWGTAIAHEFGHGAQIWLGYENGGFFRYVLYGEGFADCMAGAWYQSMVARGLADGIGIGDGREFYETFRRVADSHTTLDNHGNLTWRYGAAIYGWNTGFDGCVRWGNDIYTGRAA